MRIRWTALSLALFFLSCDPVVVFDPDEIERTDIGAEIAAIEPGFLLGTATAPHQIEGGLTNNWSFFETQGTRPDGTPRILNGDTAQVSSDSWNLWMEDIGLLEQLGANTYRFGISWSRLVPERGAWNEQAAEQYKMQLRELRARGITPMVTIFHFSMPVWFYRLDEDQHDLGGWESDQALAAFEEFAVRVAQEFGPEVDHWCTVNEPNVFALQGYTLGNFPPGVEGDTAQTSRVYARLLEAHAIAARALRTHDTVDVDGDGKATFIGLAHHVRLQQPASSHSLDITLAAITNDFVNEVVPRALTTGVIKIDVPGTITIDQEVEGLKDSVDWLGINYYEREFIRTNLSDPTLSTQYVQAGREQSDLGWDFYPEGLHHLLLRMKRYGLPIIITENGLADDDDDLRPRHMRHHLYAVLRAMQDGVEILGYYHWTLLDNFEWAEGYEARFGLFEVDFEDDARPRTARPGAVGEFQRIARGLGLEPK